ncbi:tRNA (adenosine(37)-N6)-threonylcarbamoyltransferase complex transferase subunit TsaD [Coxiella endosymbiont of Amblyomma sculptum]|uniref:tRNA (adenosine(37)-N6)-threonylcarbamoyltransferase complex transferase subunit TsaD n=1 Tax=Coxiella endosymbiont of Amblyomma sculptum TaxID=2487929 RepID=UPI00132EE574|nr:tRNA (adenosine(37)-N6)-threonylcarbamoyltransferase complex transferase subunit TsaD [Coxiella endosymbiont of Amblyomma sculptum]QHG92608.1 tRNA (adenosine(37)-N6)-threonylcarbamoyltransferase complex transferase subunit TsaD [Coxiella endosymbiont of Amblyomma sculptum]
MRYVLGIETSCDESAVALFDGQQGLLAHNLYSQIPIHAQYGGVVPELASRNHIRKVLLLIKKTLKDADLLSSDLNGIAYTKGPGLVGALMVGASVAKSLAYALGIPAIGVHHMEAHLMSIRLEEEQAPQCPFTALLVSGGHTMLILAESLGRYEILGKSVDDAAGEAFDKTARLLDLSYPGGPAIARLARKGNPDRFHFPRPMMQKSHLNFSFSGLKTYAVNCFKKYGNEKQTYADIAYAFEEAVVDILVYKCLHAIKKTRTNTLVLVGGVAANKKLRQRLRKSLDDRKGVVCCPRQEFCTDNGAMVAYTGWLRLNSGERDKSETNIQVKPRWPMNELTEISFS